MRSIRRTPLPRSSSALSGGLGRDIALVCLADALVGVSFGALAVGTGFPLWVRMLL